MSIQVSLSSEALLSISDQSRGDDNKFYEEEEEEEDDDICISIHCLRDSDPSTDKELSSNNGTPRSLVDKERQISVDPISLKQSTKPPTGNSNAGHRSVIKENYMFPPLAPTKSSKLLSSSLPGSATSSPRSGSALIKNLKKWRNSQDQLVPAPAPRAISHLARQRSAAVTPFGAQRTDHQLTHLSRSKSCGEGRTSAPSDEFDLWSKRVEDLKHENEQHMNGDEDDPESANYYEEEYRDENSSAVGSSRRKNSMGKNKSNPYDDGFKCGACLFLPGFGKGKPVRAPSSSSSSFPRRKEGGGEEEEVARNVVSRTVSLEKFECGSWSSSAIISDDHRDADGDSMQLYYDLPLELIRSSDDAHSPVATAFVFERDHRKGVLKNSSSSRSHHDQAARSSHESSRHVRFSTSNPVAHPPASPSCITPRLRKAREDFNAYLEAQGA